MNLNLLKISECVFFPNLYIHILTYVSIHCGYIFIYINLDKGIYLMRCKFAKTRDIFTNTEINNEGGSNFF